MQAVAVAAVLVLAVALAVVAPAPVFQPTAVSYVTADSVPVLALEEDEDGVRAALALIDDGPDISDVQLALTWPGDGTGAEMSGLLDGLPLD
jgi:anti-sigma-K factor RskA